MLGERLVTSLGHSRLQPYLVFDSGTRTSS
jgi:hypothetical protein